MTAPQPGTPVGPAPQHSVVFDHIPDIVDILRRKYFLGVTYAQVCTHNQLAAQNEGFRPIRGAVLYSIAGTKGVAAMALMGQGSPIEGASADSGIPTLYTDSEVERLTGHATDPEFTLNFQEESHGSIEVEAGVPETGPDPGQQDRGQSRDPQQEDRYGSKGGSEPHAGPGSGESERHNPPSTEEG